MRSSKRQKRNTRRVHNHKSRRIHGGTLPNFYHTSTKNVGDLYNLNADNVGREAFKPVGFWISEANEWQEFCKDAGWNYGSSCITYKVEIDPATLLKIDTIAALRSLKQKYGDSDGAIDWAAVSGDYDGIWFSNYPTVRRAAMKEADRHHYTWFIAVDINSACIWRPSRVIKSITKST